MRLPVLFLMMAFISQSAFADRKFVQINNDELNYLLNNYYMILEHDNVPFRIRVGVIDGYRKCQPNEKGCIYRNLLVSISTYDEAPNQVTYAVQGEQYHFRGIRDVVLKEDDDSSEYILQFDFDKNSTNERVKISFDAVELLYGMEK